jgi:hypothetical protein
MQEFKILGHIDLPERKIKPEQYRDLLENKMSGISHEVNEQFGCEFLDDKGSIKIAGTETAEADQKFVNDLEADWASRQYKTVDEWRQSKDKNPATITEMAVTASLHRLLGERFIVARASSYDDYANHVDNVLIDKQTGAIVCGFDEVLGYEGDDGGEIKTKKTQDILAKGGSSLKYGATIEDGKIKRQEINNIPTFYLSLSKEELAALLKDIKASGEATGNEKNLVVKMVASLEQQYEEAQKIASGAKLVENLNKFSESLQVIQEQINKINL